MRLTPEFVSKTPSNLNALKERELDLRGLAIPVIENLASHQGTYDTLNLADNSLTVLGNIPLAPRLRQLHAPLNQISSISPALPTSLPNLITINLSDNAISSLSTLSPLEHLVHLRHLSLRNNPITSLKHYRAFIICRIAKGNLHTLDFVRIKNSERLAARKLLLDEDTNLPNELALKLATSTTSGTTAASAVRIERVTDAGAGVGVGGKGRLMTPDEKRRVVEALTAAQTTEEVRRLERMLAEGIIPDDAPEAQEAQEEVQNGQEAGVVDAMEAVEADAGAGADEAEGEAAVSGEGTMEVEETEQSTNGQ